MRAAACRGTRLCNQLVDITYVCELDCACCTTEQGSAYAPHTHLQFCIGICLTPVDRSSWQEVEQRCLSKEVDFADRHCCVVFYNKPPPPASGWSFWQQAQLPESFCSMRVALQQWLPRQHTALRLRWRDMTKPTTPTPCCSWTFDGTTPGCGMAVLAGRQFGMGEERGRALTQLISC